MKFRYDKSSKWLIEHHADAILRLAGIGPVQSFRTLFSEVVQPRQLPDGLIEATLVGELSPDLYLLEINTYPDSRVPVEMLDGMLLTYLDRRRVPEVLTLVLHPKGNVVVADHIDLASKQNNAFLSARWRVVELWKVPAEPLLALDDPGLAPWITLAQFSGPAEPIVRQCRDLIERKAPAREQANLLAVTQVLAGLRYDTTMLRSILGGREKMIESPVLRELLDEELAKRSHRLIGTVLRARFGSVPPRIAAALESVTEESVIDTLTEFATLCPSLDAFAAQLAIGRT